MRKDCLTLALVPLLLVSCSCSHKMPSGNTQAAAPRSASATTDTAALQRVDDSVTPVSAMATPDQALRLTLLDEQSHEPVYHAGLNLTGSKHLQWTDKQGRWEWAGAGIATSSAIEIRCPAMRAETGRKIKTVAYAMKGPLTDISATIDTSVCIEPPEKTTTGSYAGTFYKYYGHGAFVPCAGLPADAYFYGNSKSAWVNLSDAATSEFDKLSEAASIAPDSDKPVHVEWTGSLTGPGGYGQLGAFSYKLDVTEVRLVSTDFPEDCPVGELK